jgi:hypothetical protein
MGWRDNDGNVRNIAVASGDPGAVTVQNQVVATHTDWLTFTCPVQGPAIAETAAGNYLVAWSDDSDGDSNVWVVSSSDFVNWGAERNVAPKQSGRQQNPGMVVAGSGRVYLAFAQQGSHWLTWSDSHGATWSPPEEVRVGTMDIERADLAAGADQVWIEGEANGKIWVKRLE